MPRRPTRSALPAAGHGRSEELKKRADGLAQELDASPAEGIDPAKLRPDHDAQVALHAAGLIDGNEVEDAQPGYVYAWIREDKPGDQVRWKLSRKVKMPDGFFAPLWEIVSGDMPEASGMRDVRGYRKMVDTILLRARADRYRAYQMEIAELNRLRLHGTSDGMQDLADRSRGQIKVYSESEISNEDTLARAANAGFARSAFTKKLREGTAHHI